MAGLGLSFLPTGGQEGQQGDLNGQSPSGVAPLQQAIQLLSVRLAKPRIYGANAPTHSALLNSPGGAGVMGRPGLPGGPGGGGVLERLLMALYGMGPGGSPGGGQGGAPLPRFDFPKETPGQGIGDVSPMANSPLKPMGPTQAAPDPRGMRSPLPGYRPMI